MIDDLVWVGKHCFDCESYNRIKESCTEGHGDGTTDACENYEER